MTPHDIAVAAAHPRRPASDIDLADAVPRHRAARRVAGVLFFLVCALLVSAIARNPNIEWHTVFHYLTFSTILDGVVTTLWLTAAGMALGSAGGVLLALARNSADPLIRLPADIYVWFFRGTPLLIQLIFWYNFAIFLPRLDIRVPFTGLHLLSASTNDLVKPLVAALLGLVLHEAAYMCEIVRAGFLSVPRGQSDAGLTLGLTPGQITRQVVLPQAMRFIIPPAGSQLISMLKATSLVSVMSVFDLFYSAQSIYSTNGRVVPLLVVAALWYLFLTSLLYLVQARIERRYGRGDTRPRGVR
ncbi:amino acid ABC transporter permease [Nocardia sp. alder85J]|uniref:amino acid ABC transporter permease n=1 Tax=Nocardia sp. alder85J TaxID=2862949 RepID=UPI001CD786C4|nr:amino acid ABC transporter permease [Nocardia sp. alder85J]MCX4098182.1 amino acid ABC transporter permease [Nocardia sp. alder85J]